MKIGNREPNEPENKGTISPQQNLGGTRTPDAKPIDGEVPHERTERRCKNQSCKLCYPTDKTTPESNKGSEISFDPVTNYLEQLPEEHVQPTLDTEIKNTYGGSGPILSYNENNSGANVLLATDNIYKELKKRK
ncbi:hypothetical protein BCR36DRAFT_369736 [Piromyces finnis]|uniref:Uncharacterized protein n=1 Tax=Piromyces finnis TaxID=1754191 RepID=A0A1Y1VCJ5_9FUNG|nr:hypothetical protein BCR36DRAFT_369736 [Piromyces finnis]|eukprot:ORX51828.1 hypothetical protein BCR36DRAFT_369736 [Piromyces finnis]